MRCRNLILLFFLFSNVCFSAPNIGYSSLKEFRYLGGGKTYICIGDSITVGVGSTDDWGYRKKLQILLDDETIPFKGTYKSPDEFTWDYYIYHEGIGGQTTAQIEARVSGILSNWVTDSNFEYSIFLHAGTNDTKTTEQNRQDAVDNIEDIIDIIDAYDSSINIYAALVIPTDGYTGTDATTLYNSQLKTMLETYQASKSNLYIVDHESVWVANENFKTEWLDDSVHPNDAGYQIMANTWATAIQANE